MASCKWKTHKIIIVASLGFICFCLATVLSTIGGIFYVEDKSKVLNYVNTMCKVQHQSSNSYKCILYFVPYTCYVAAWTVHYHNSTSKPGTVEATTRYRDSSDTSKEADKYQSGLSYSCWYDTRNPSVAQWNQPSTRNGIILLSGGGLSALLSIVFFYLMHLFLKEPRCHNERTNGGLVRFVLIK